MKTKTLIGLAAATAVTTQVGSAGIVLAGWHAFTPSAGAAVDSPASEGVAGFTDIGLNGTYVRHGAATDSGGSTDNFYGPDSTATGGIKTQQTPYGGTNNDEITGPGDPRLNPGYTDPVGFNGSQPGTTMDGRIVSANLTDVVLTNNSTESYVLQDFVFDAFLGEVSQDERATFNEFTVVISIGSGVNNLELLPIVGYTGTHSNDTFPFATPANTPFGPNASDIAIPNEIVYGTGANYVDYRVSFEGIPLADRTLGVGDEVQLRFNTLGKGTVRLDNLAFIAVPEPSSALALGGLLGLGLMSNRRRR